jgi:hypothetical protein
MENRSDAFDALRRIRAAGSSPRSGGLPIC